MPRYLSRTFGAALAMGVALAGCASSSVSRVTPGPVGISRATPSLFDEPWSWVDDHGVATTFGAFRGEPLVVTAIYTSCTVRCPFTVEKLEEVARAYQRSGRTARFFLVTLDPHTDTPERLHRFKEARHLPEDWHLLAGSDLDTRALSRRLDVRAMWDDGHIDHDVRIGVFDANGRLVRSYADWSFDAGAAVVSR
jgi:protein SCO1/2